MSEGVQPTKQGADKLKPYLSPLGAFALSVGTSIGWGSLVITSTSFLSQAGPAGSMVGLAVGLATMALIACNYSYLIERYPHAGGSYTFAKEVFGCDYSFVVAWFLSLTYFAMLVANATSLPLFARYFVGDVFRFGLCYQLFGYQVYLGEILLTVVALVAAGALCARSNRTVSEVMSGLVLLLAVCICICFCAAMLGLCGAGGSLQPGFVPNTSAFQQVLHVACMTPWAFIGFESIAHASSEFTFPQQRVSRVLGTSLVVITVLYAMVTLLSSTAYPPRYESWFAYLADAGNLTGLEALPPFYAAQHHLGSLGVWLLMVALLALILTSLLGNIVALSRLLYALGMDSILPVRFARLNARGIPEHAIRFIMMVAVATPLLGRTTIGWIVDVTTLGATLVYAFISFAAVRKARIAEDGLRRMTGLVGGIAMVILGLLLLLPNQLMQGSMATESYFLFTAWAIAGFLCFRAVLRQDDEQQYGKTAVVWIALLSLVLVTSLTWMSDNIEREVDQTTADIVSSYQWPTSEKAEVVEETISRLHRGIERHVVAVAVLFAFSMGVMLSNFSIIQKREKENARQLGVARAVANTDPLTGIKNKNAYVAREAEMNHRISERTQEDFAVVVCDVNGLKWVNDTLGHKEGDEYIRSACRLICATFRHSPVFRIGGDEFVVILMGGDYERRDELLAGLDERSVSNIERGEVVVSAGMAEYQPEGDHHVEQVFERADALMYRRKKELKALPGAERLNARGSAKA